MEEEKLLAGKRVLIVDDEPDVLESLEALLSMCDLAKARSFEEARDLLENQEFDLAILDIMGVNGYQLLDIANERKILAVMLTAHALSPEDTVKSYKRGAAFFVPKEETSKIATFLGDVLEAKEKGSDYWTRWLERLGTFYDKKFGPDWKDSDRDFWEKLAKQDWRLASVLRRNNQGD
ncbi:MAG: response regulator [Deltaproteobacteria bacterium]|nr:response regulator [Deltaproteobacteria bacterium]MBW2139132.1 response regulator [Deltaproteobacteria bacterium]